MDQRERLNQRLVGLFNRLLQQEEQALAPVAKDLSLREIHCIEQVCAAGGMSTMGELAERLSITLGTLTVCVNRLEFKGYVRRRRDARDRRIVRLMPTDKAIATDRLHQAFHRGMVDDISRHLSEAEMERLLDMLGSIEAYFQRRAGEQEHEHGC